MTLTIRLCWPDRYKSFLKTALLIPVLFLVACTTTKIPEPDWDHIRQQDIASSHIIAKVPLISQSDHYCGPASLAMVSQYYGRNLSKEAAAEMVYTAGRKGTFQHDMVTAFSRNGFIAIRADSLDEIIEEIHKDNPVIVFQNLAFSWAPKWHFAVITGYDLSRNGFYIHSGKRKNHFVSFKTFGKSWNKGGRWAYVVTPPEKLPVTAEFPDLIQSVAKLEKTGQIEAALKGYYAIVEKYPQNHDGWFGLANIMMLKKKYKEAERFYQLSLDNKPTVYAYNNMAYALSYQGRDGEACKLLDDAMSLFLSEQKDMQDRFQEELADTQNDICHAS